jgi:Protein of unknown function (DUF3122)
MKIHRVMQLIVSFIIVLLIYCSVILWAAPNAFATVTQHEEKPGQILFTAKQKLSDQNGYSWQVIVFRQIYPGRQDDVYLRLVGFPGMVAIDHNQPLLLQNKRGDSFLAQPDPGELTKNRISPNFYVGQYSLEGLVSKLNPTVDWQAIIPTQNQKGRVLNIPSPLIQEWQITASMGSRQKPPLSPG